MNSFIIKFYDEIEIYHGIFPRNYNCRSDGKFSYMKRHQTTLYSVNPKYTVEIIAKDRMIQHNSKMKFKADLL